MSYQTFAQQRPEHGQRILIRDNDKHIPVTYHTEEVEDGLLLFDNGDVQYVEDMLDMVWKPTQTETTHHNATFGIQLSEVGDGFTRARITTLAYPNHLQVDGYGLSQDSAMENLATQIRDAQIMLGKMLEIVEGVQEQGVKL